MNLRSVDLNLLVILQALLEEQHVTRAARRLSLSQPATSNALERCRHLFDDQLLQRVSGEMRLTAKAQALKEPLEQVLTSVADIIGCSKLDPRRVPQTVRLVMADEPGNCILQALLPLLRETDPQLDVVMLPWRGSDDALYRLESGEADIAISNFGTLAPKYRQSPLRSERCVVAMREDHPALAAFSLDQWLAWPHVVVSGEGSKRGSLEDVLAPMRLGRRVGAVVPNFMMVGPILRRTDYIALAPEGTLSGGGIARVSPPIEVPPLEMQLAWHIRRNDDPVVQNVLRNIAKLFDAPVPVRTPAALRAPAIPRSYDPPYPL